MAMIAFSGNARQRPAASTSRHSRDSASSLSDGARRTVGRAAGLVPAGISPFLGAVGGAESAGWTGGSAIGADVGTSPRDSACIPSDAAAADPVLTDDSPDTQRDTRFTRSKSSWIDDGRRSLDPVMASMRGSVFSPTSASVSTRDSAGTGIFVADGIDSSDSVGR